MGHTVEEILEASLLKQRIIDADHLFQGFLGLPPSLDIRFVCADPSWLLEHDIRGW